MNKISLAAAAFAGFFATASSAQVLTTFEEFTTTPTANGTVLFRAPSFSGSTGAKLTATPNLSQVVVADPATLGSDHGNVLNVQFGYATVTDPWLRLTTSGATSFPNPTLDLSQYLIFDIYSDKEVGIAVGIRETESGAGIFADGGSGGTIEFIGATGKNLSAPITSRTIPAGQWVRVAFDLDGEPTQAFTGDGVLDKGTDGKGVLEHLAFVPVGGDLGPYNIYLDNFRLAPIPEPSTYAMAFGALALAGGMIRRRFQQK